MRPHAAPLARFAPALAACATLAFASTTALAQAAPASPPIEAERTGGRFGVALLGGFALGTSTSAMVSAPTGLAGLALRFGGAVTDRFHLLGEFTLAVLPGGSLQGTDITAFHAAINLAAQGYIGPRLFVRGGVGAGWAAAVAGSTWLLPLPGPRLSGAVGYDLWRSGQQSFSLALETSYTFLFNADYFVDRLFTLGLGVGFDWY